MRTKRTTNGQLILWYMEFQQYTNSTSLAAEFDIEKLKFWYQNNKLRIDAAVHLSDKLLKKYFKHDENGQLAYEQFTPEPTEANPNPQPQNRAILNEGMTQEGFQKENKELVETRVEVIFPTFVIK